MSTKGELQNEIKARRAVEQFQPLQIQAAKHLTFSEKPKPIERVGPVMTNGTWPRIRAVKKGVLDGRSCDRSEETVRKHQQRDEHRIDTSREGVKCSCLGIMRGLLRPDGMASQYEEAIDDRQRHWYNVKRPVTTIS